MWQLQSPQQREAGAGNGVMGSFPLKWLPGGAPVPRKVQVPGKLVHIPPQHRGPTDLPAPHRGPPAVQETLGEDQDRMNTAPGGNSPGNPSQGHSGAQLRPPGQGLPGGPGDSAPTVGGPRPSPLPGAQGARLCPPTGENSLAQPFQWLPPPPHHPLVKQFRAFSACWRAPAHWAWAPCSWRVCDL